MSSSDTIKVVVHYGPIEYPPADPADLFTRAAAALAEGTPQLSAAEEGSAASLGRVPLVYLPPETLGRFLVSAERRRALTEGRGTPGVLSAARAVAAAREAAAARMETLRDYTHHGSPALEVSTHSYGVVVVTNEAQWGAVQRLVLREMIGDGGAKEARRAEVEESVEMHVEVTVLWFEVDTMHRLHYEDLAGGGPTGPAGGGVVRAGPRSPAGNKLSSNNNNNNNNDAESTPRGVVNNHYKTVNNHNTTYNYYGGDAAGGGDGSRRASSRGDRKATLLVVDTRGAHEGEVRVGLESPAATAEELLSLVREAVGAAPSQQLRAAYRVLPPQALQPERVEGGYRNSVAPSVLAAAPLHPLEGDQDVEALVRDVLLYGYRAIRVVVARPGESLENTHDEQRYRELGDNDDDDARPPLRGEESQDPRLRAHSVADPRLRYEEVEHPRLRYEEYEDPRLRYEEYEDPRLRYEEYEDPRLRYEEYEDPRLRYEEVEHPRLRYEEYEDPRLRYEEVEHPRLRSSSFHEATAAAVRELTQPQEDEVFEAGGDERPFSTAAYPTEEPLEDEEAGRRTSVVQQLVVVRCDMDPTEVSISGVVREAALAQLGDDIFDKVCKRGAAKTDPESIGTPAEEWAARPRFEKVTTEDGGVEYVMRLHDYIFDEDQEDQLAACIDMAMQKLEGYEPIASNEMGEEEEEAEEGEEARMDADEY